MMSFTRYLGLGLLTVLLVNGCKLNSTRNASGGIKAKLTQHVMPNVVNTDLDASGGILTAAGLKVYIKVNEYTVSPEDGVSSHSYTVRGMIEQFKSHKWNHMIASQLPAPGTPVQPGTLVMLKKGNHHGAGPFRPWLVSHKWSVEIRGECRCRDCHLQVYCLDCHSKIGMAGWKAISSNLR